MSSPSQNRATARSSVSLASPTLPPSASRASAMAAIRAGTHQSDANVRESRGDWGMRLVHRDLDCLHAGKACEDSVHHGTGSGFDQLVALGGKGAGRRVG